MADYLGFPLFLERPNWDSPPRTDFLASVDQFKDFGAIDYAAVTPESSMGFQAEFFRLGKDQIASAWIFIDGRFARLHGFWMPSWQVDVVLTAPIAATDNEITIEDIEYAAYWLPNEIVGRHLYMEWPDKSYVIRKVVGAPTSTTLHLNGAVGKAAPVPGQICISFLLFVRLDLDQVQCAYNAAHVGTFELPFLTIPLDTFPDPPPWVEWETTCCIDGGPPPFPVDDVYVVRNHPIGGGDGSQMCRFFKRSKTDLSTIDWYGGGGTGIDQLGCPWGVGVDATHAYICDMTNDRLMKRAKDTLDYVAHRGWMPNGDPHYACRWVHCTKDFVYTSIDFGVIEKLNKASLGTLLQGSGASSNGLTSDRDYLYSTEGYTVVKYDLNTLVRTVMFGRSMNWARSVVGLGMLGNYLYVGDYGPDVIMKVNSSTWEIVEQVSSTGSVQALAAYGSLVAVASWYGVMILDADDLSLVEQMDYPFEATYGIAMDANYIYVADLYLCCVLKFDAFTREWIAEYGDRDQGGGQDTIDPYAIAIDATHLYVVDMYDNMRVIKIQTSDMTYVDEYMDPWEIFSNPTGIIVDDTYIYVNDGDQLHRINKSTMEYVDARTLTEGGNGYQMVIENGNLWVGDYAATYAVTKYDLATLAVLDHSPLYGPNPEYHFIEGLGITCDLDHLYVADGPAFSGYNWYKVKIFDRETGAYVDTIELPRLDNVQLTCDENYLYGTFYDWNSPGFYTIKFQKTSPYVEVSRTLEYYGCGIDTCHIFQIPW